MKKTFSRFATDYGMVFVLLLLCAFFSVTTFQQQHPTGSEGGKQLARLIQKKFDRAQIVVFAHQSDDGQAFASALNERLGDRIQVLESIVGQPADVRRALQSIIDRGDKLDAVACNKTVSDWTIVSDLPDKFPELSQTQILLPQSYWFPDFLKSQNLSNVASQSSVFAIMAIGMTMVIITAGIDLSVGSLVALSAVFTSLLIRDWFGGVQATPAAMGAAIVAGIALCGLVGALTGLFVTRFGIPSFIVTLAMMSIARGLAQIAARGQSVYEIPVSFSEFANGKLLGLPNSVIMMIGLYIVAHIVMSRTKLGRHIYAVGGNPEAARLSGVPVAWVLLFVYAVCGALAGLGGAIEASRLGSGSPLYGNMYELYVIAAVVVGGTSLAGGEGKILSTLIGALIIAVIRNGMNLMGIESYTQGVVMGVLILAAVMIDMVKKRGWRIFR